jgi:5-methylcytosine-specific restriction endonuclease McrA
MMSRAYYEWYLRRGRDIRLRPIRDKIPLALRERVIRRDGLWCGLCGGPVERDDIHIDHIRPVSLGGKTVLANLQVAHSLCNLKKGNRVHDVG